MVPRSHTQRMTFDRFSLGKPLRMISSQVHLYEVLWKALFWRQAYPIVRLKLCLHQKLLILLPFPHWNSLWDRDLDQKYRLENGTYTPPQPNPIISTTMATVKTLSRLYLALEYKFFLALVYQCPSWLKARQP